MPSNTLTPTEWKLMECLWEQSPRTGREAVEFMESFADWSRSTTLTMLRRMTEKGYLRCDILDGVRAYSPLISRETAAVQATDSFLHRVYQGSVNLMLTALTDRQQLSKEEIDELYAILDKAKEEAP